MRRIVAAAGLIVLLGAWVGAQAKPRLAVLPFTGGEAGDGETVAMLLSYQPEIAGAFTLVPWNAGVAGVLAGRMQNQTSLTDAGTLNELGAGINADYAVAGHIQKLGERSLIHITIVDVRELRQIAGDYREYRSIEEVAALLPEMAKRLAGAVGFDAATLPKLAVLELNAIDQAVGKSDATALSQLLVTEVANSRKYAVLPFDKPRLERVMEEYHIERYADFRTSPNSIKAIGKAVNAEYVLVSEMRSLGEVNMFMVSILNTEDSSQLAGGYVNYVSITDGLHLMSELSYKITGVHSRANASFMPDHFVRLEGGRAALGSPESEEARDRDELPHEVVLAPFYIGKYEVTQREYQEIMGVNPSTFKGPDLPVEQVSWYDAVEYCNKRSERDGLKPVYTINKTRADPGNLSEFDTVRWQVSWDRNADGYRLPTEAEWEYACRAGTRTAFNTGANIITSLANFDGNNPYSGPKGVYREKTLPAGTFPPSAFGLYDMHGNVREWCWDWYGTYYPELFDAPEGVRTGAYRVTRGGGWYDGGAYLRSSYRDAYTPSYRNHYLGFRIVRSDF
jgi:formylglycine-generating enzyme required for sulfatase activity/TolB-like protein